MRRDDGRSPRAYRCRRAPARRGRRSTRAARRHAHQALSLDRRRRRRRRRRRQRPRQRPRQRQRPPSRCGGSLPCANARLRSVCSVHLRETIKEASASSCRSTRASTFRTRRGVGERMPPRRARLGRLSVSADAIRGCNEGGNPEPPCLPRYLRVLWSGFQDSLDGFRSAPDRLSLWGGVRLTVRRRGMCMDLRDLGI